MTRQERWDDSPFFPGDIVLDEDNPTEEGVVISLPSKQAHEWDVPGRGILAEDNPEYPDDDDIVVILFQKTLCEEFPYYSGVKPLEVSKLSAQGINHYAFPASRLEKIGEIDTHDISLSKVVPSPYHSRTFEFEEEVRLVAEVDRQGGLPKPALLRVVSEERFTILNGHKRIWAAHVLGLESVEARCMYVDDFHAAHIFASRHLDEDPEESDHSSATQEKAIRLLQEKWGEKASQIAGVPTSNHS
jgi:ParB family chromosome partitioning protein